MSRRHRQGEAGMGVNLALIITPFLDFSFQLLFLFVCLYQPSALEGQIAMRLPQPAEARGSGDLPNEGDEPKFEAEVTVQVKTEHGGLHSGGISQIVVVRDGKSTEVKDVKELQARLEEMRSKLNNQDDIKIQGDSKLKWAGMIQIVDACRNAKFKNPAFQAPPDLVR
jgi:biopolymer transport protein ExbD